MARLVSFMITHYFSIPFEQFRAKFISAIGLFTMIEKPNPSDFKKILYIEKNTHPEVMVSWYKMCRHYDRDTDNDKKQFVKFRRNDWQMRETKGLEKDIALSKDEIDRYLSMQMREVHNLVIKNIKYYNEDMKIPIFEEEKEDIDVSKLGMPSPMGGGYTKKDGRVKK